jgi:hypothetical protein
MTFIPIILREGKFSQRDLIAFKAENSISVVYDIYERQLNELVEFMYPGVKGDNSNKTKQEEFIKRYKGGNSELNGVWIYFPWSKDCIHMLGEHDYYCLRTNRNRNLINVKEQKILSEFVVGITGLSIGSNIAVGLVHQGISNSIKLADVDRLETSNLNRVKAKLRHIDMSKIEFVCQEIYEVNPFADITPFPNGVTKDSIDDFFCSEPVPRVVFDEIDDIEMKIRLRLKAKEVGVPVIMFSNVGDKIIIDVERYDLDKKLEIFNGVLGDISNEVLAGEEITDLKRNEYAVRIVERKNVSQRALSSVKEINKTLVGRPQLNSTVTVSSGFAIAFIKRLALDESLPSGRQVIDIESVCNGNATNFVK